MHGAAGCTPCDDGGLWLARPLGAFYIGLMNFATDTPFRVELPRGRLLSLRGARGSSLRVCAGMVWITAEDCEDDVFLAAGESWEVACDGLVLVESHRPRGARGFEAGASVEIRGLEPLIALAHDPDPKNQLEPSSAAG